jgi:hypothetical protein
MKVADNYTFFGNVRLHVVFLGYELSFHLHNFLTRFLVICHASVASLSTFKSVLVNVTQDTLDTGSFKEGKMNL